MVAHRATNRVRESVWPLGLMFPDIQENSDPILARLLVEIDDGCVCSDTRRIEEVANRVFRRLAADYDLISIRNHP